MGLTLHYDARLPRATPAAARTLVLALHRRAQALARAGQFERVLGVSSDAEDLDRFAAQWLLQADPADPHTTTGLAVVPLAGWIFPVAPGDGCELLWLGLCRYPATVRHGAGEIATRLDRGWRMRAACKTQYAGRHGWEHFRRCHTTAIALLRDFAALGATVRITDEGGWWPRRSDATLRRTLADYDGLVAALGGALKDAADDGGPAVESPIFAHPQFERLEAEGAARHGEKIAAAVQRIATENRGK